MSIVYVEAHVHEYTRTHILGTHCIYVLVYIYVHLFSWPTENIDVYTMAHIVHIMGN